MKTASAALITLLAGNQFIMADLYTITLIDGTVLRYTSYDGSLVVSGNTFVSAGPLMERGATKTQIGVQVDTLEVRFLANNTITINGLTLTQFAQQGGFDGARLELDRCFMGTPGDTSAGSLIMFVGRVGDIDVTRTAVIMTVNSDLELLNVSMPRNLYQSGCIHTLYDAGCGIVKATFAVSGNVSANGTNNTTVTCNMPQANGFFDQGTITYTSGTNNGKSYGVKSYVAGVLTLLRPVTTLAGDTFTAYPGCDKLQATCGATSNITVTASNVTKVFTAVAHGLANDKVVQFTTTGNLPAPIVANTSYFVMNAAANTFQVSTGIRGAAANLTTNGTGTNTVSMSGKFSNLIHFRGYPYIPSPEAAVL